MLKQYIKIEANNNEKTNQGNNAPTNLKENNFP